MKGKEVKGESEKLLNLLKS